MNPSDTPLKDPRKHRAHALVVWALLLVCIATLSACANYSFKRKAPFEKTDKGFWYRADCQGPCDLESGVAERERLRKLAEKLRREAVCPAGYILEKRTPLAVTRTAPPDIIVYEGRCIDRT